MYKKLKFDYGREALKYLLKTYKIKEIYLPYYLCEVVRHAVVEAGAKPIFYHIDDEFMPQEEFDKSSYILYPNYFGVCDKNVKLLCEKYPKLIVDNAHSFYSKPSGFACFNCEHKFLPVEKGSYLWIPTDEKEDEIEPNPSIINERKQRFLALHEKYSATNNLHIDTDCVSPFCYPYLASTIEEADELAAELQKSGNEVFRYWKELPKSYNEYKFYSRLVPISLL